MGGALKLLLVDDDADIRAATRAALEQDAAVDVRTAGGGGEALELLRDRSWQPDCVLLDAAMPDLGGEQVLSAVRAVPRAVDLPVILLTARVRPGDIARYLSLGAMGVIAKPFDPLTLAREVRDMLAQALRSG